MDLITKQTEQIVELTQDRGFYVRVNRGLNSNAKRETVIVYEDSESNVDVLVFQHMIQGYADRCRYELYDFGYIYNTTGSDLYQSTDPEFETDDFSKLKQEWEDRINDKL